MRDEEAIPLDPGQRVELDRDLAMLGSAARTMILSGWSAEIDSPISDAIKVHLRIRYLPNDAKRKGEEFRCMSN